MRGVPTFYIQWLTEGYPVYSEPLQYQQIYVVPTDSPHTTTYTCEGFVYDGSSTQTISGLRKNVTVIVEGKSTQSTHITRQ